MTPTLGRLGPAKKEPRFRERVEAPYHAGDRVNTPSGDVGTVRTVLACGEKGRGEVRYYLDIHRDRFYYGEDLKPAPKKKKKRRHWHGRKRPNGQLEGH